MEYYDVIEVERIRTLETLRELDLYDPVNGHGWLYWEERRQEAINDMPEEIKPLLSENRYEEVREKILE